MITRDLGRRPEDADDVWANVAEVAAEVEAELDVLVRNAEDRVVARIQAAQGALSPTLQDALRRALAAAVRDTLARRDRRPSFRRSCPRTCSSSPGCRQILSMS